MAFRQPTQAPQPLVSPIREDAPNLEISVANQQHRPEDSQEWVLFSPDQASSTDQTPCTAGRSRLTDFGSLASTDFSPRIEGGDVEADSEVLETTIDEDEELDSLDDGLRAFQEPEIYRRYSTTIDQGGDSILPVHDGLGTFQAPRSPTREQLWQFERYNPQRRSDGTRHRRSSVQRHLDAIEESMGPQGESDRMQRIEQWRMEQSRAVLDEIEKETRRRRMSRASVAAKSTHETIEEEQERSTLADFHDTDHESAMTVPPSENADSQEQESFWKRITRRVIRDLIGIDEPLLSVILGEELPEEDEEEEEQSATPRTSFPTNSTISQPFTDTAALVKGWEDKLLERIARELGVLVNHFSERSRAFSTYTPLPDPSQEYAGIPISRSSTPRPVLVESSLPSTTKAASDISPIFKPTLDQFSEPTPRPRGESHEERLKRERAYWERDLSVKMVFRYLRDRFTDSYPTSRPSQASSSRRKSSISSINHSYNNVAISQTPESAYRAAIIRHNHPLVARSQQDRERRRQRDRDRSKSILQGHYLRKRTGSSCASQSTRTNTQAGSGSSRCYWDFPGTMSVGSGSVGVRTWGEA
ncbi:MAG: hypothetical protein M1834_007290 [Cirrosporium novae-zelandiae]|nr:MAG: hypothetical protein M1834_007290 [Cirrosporium novae-zelandiae]